MIDLAITDVSIQNEQPIDVSSSSDSCYTYILTGQSSCGYTAPESTLYLNGVMAPVEYDEVEDGIENDSGTFTRTFWALKSVFSMDVVVDNKTLRWLRLMKGFDTLKIQRKSGGSPIEITNLQISEPAAEMGGSFVVTLTFEDPDITEQSGCCGSAYAGSPFEDPCPPDWDGEPDPNDPCNNFEVTVTYNDESITASTAGGGAGNVNYKWYYDRFGNGNFEFLIDGVSVIVPDGAGVYRVVAIKGACQDVDAVMVQEPCSLFDVFIYQDLDTIRSRVIAGQGDPAYTWTYIDEEANETVLPDDTDSIRPDKTGFYRLDVEDGECEGSDTIYMEVFNECDFDVIITDNGDGTYTASYDDYDGSDTPSYRWEKETTDGIVAFGTGDTITPDEEGVYRAYITLDNCEVQDYVLVMGLCVQFKAFIQAVIPGSSSYTLYAGSVNAPGSVVYEWYQWTGSTYVLIGVGSQVTTTQVGTVKLVGRSGTCVKEDKTEIAMDFIDMWMYQKFVLVGAEDHVEVTEFTLPDIANLHPDHIAWLVEVTENGVEQVYGHEVLPVNLHRLEYSIDGQNVNLNPAYTRAGSIIVVKMRKE